MSFPALSGAICGGAPFVWRREPAGDKWCFADRARIPHEWQLRGDVPEGEPSWYEPIWLCVCSRCGKDRTHFGDGS